MRVVIITRSCPQELEYEVNTWIKLYTKGIADVIDIKYGVVNKLSNYIEYSAMIIYKQ